MDKNANEKIIVSIIVPVYNVEKYIEECFSSLFPQIDSHFEIICIDDGSTDGCGRICDSYAERYPNCRVVHKENGGLGAARNTGLEMVRGEYIGFVDPDDYVAGDWANSILDCIAEQQCDLLFFDYHRVKNTQLELRSYGEGSGLVNKEELLQDVVIDRKIQSQVWQKVFRASLFEGIRFPERRRCLEDYSIFHLLLEKAQSIYYLKKPLYFYRIRLERVTDTVYLQYPYDNYLVAKARYDYFINKGVQVPPIGMYVQLLLFCTFYWQAEPEERAKYTREYADLKRIVADNARSVIFDSSLDFKFRLKYTIVYLHLDRLLALYLRYGALGALQRILRHAK